MKYLTETVFYLTPKFWSIVPETIKNSKSLEQFKLKNESKYLNIHVDYT